MGREEVNQIISYLTFALLSLLGKDGIAPFAIILVPFPAILTIALTAVILWLAPL
jgi:hypothetical protein